MPASEIKMLPNILEQSEEYEEQQNDNEDIIRPYPMTKFDDVTQLVVPPYVCNDFKDVPWYDNGIPKN